MGKVTTMSKLAPCANTISPSVDAPARARYPPIPQPRSSRSVLPITSDFDRQLFGKDDAGDHVGWLDGGIARFGRSYAGEPDRIAEELAQDVAVQAADTILLTVPSQLGVDYNAHMLETIARDIAPAIGWSPARAETVV